jgi:hypothetical protein
MSEEHKYRVYLDWRDVRYLRPSWTIAECHAALDVAWDEGALGLDISEFALYRLEKKLPKENTDEN